MQNIRRRLRSTVMAGLLAPALFLVVSVALPGVAEARCVGSTPVTSTLIISGTTVVSETPVSGTCNGNNFYQATFRSNVAGWRASVWIQNGGIWTPHFTSPYSYRDDNSHSLIQLCLDNGVSQAYCGWGTNYIHTNTGVAGVIAYDHTYYGVNSGF